MMDAAAYLARIGYTGDTTPTVKLLHTLQYTHLHTVPYENLDIIRRIPLSLSMDTLYDKIVTKHRGGYCFELNELFAQLLRALGYEVTDYFARFLWDEKTIPKRRHHVLGVSVPGDMERWLCDVGVGVGSPNYPVKMAYGEEQTQDGERYRFDLDSFLGWVLKRYHHGAWKPLFSFSEEPQLPHDFLTTSFYCEHAEDSPFNKKAIVAIRTENGRMTLDGDTFKIFEGEDVKTWEEPTEEARLATLQRLFGIVL